METLYIPSGRFPEGVQKHALSFTLSFGKKKIQIDESFDICIFLTKDNDTHVALTDEEVKILKIVDVDDCSGENKTISEFIENVIVEEKTKLKNKTQKKLGSFHYNNGEWEETDPLTS